jgi:hypothetical protein
MEQLPLIRLLIPQLHIQITHGVLKWPLQLRMKKCDDQRHLLPIKYLTYYYNNQFRVLFANTYIISS